MTNLTEAGYATMINGDAHAAATLRAASGSSSLFASAAAARHINAGANYGGADWGAK